MESGTESIRLVPIDGLSWRGMSVRAFLPVLEDERHICGAVVFWSDMPEALQQQFQKWLEKQQIPIGMPPIGLPRQEHKYFLEDVLSALDSI